MKKYLLILFCALCFFNTTAFASSNNQNQKVLFISSYSYSWLTVPLQIEGIQEGLSDDITLDIQYMDTKTLEDDVTQKNFYETIKYKLQTVTPYDAIIVGDDAALQFVVKYQQELFKDIPIVFEGINNIDYAKEVSKNPLITGIIEKYSYEKNIDFALQMNKNATKIVAIVDDTVTGIGEQQQFFAQEVNYPQLDFSVINVSKLTRKEIEEQISNIGDDTIFIYLIFSEDTDGNIYTDKQVCNIIREYANVPTFRFVQSGIGDGLLGGNIVSHKESGLIASQMVMQILNGTDPSTIEMKEESPNLFYFDQKVIDKFKISSKIIPEEAVIINQNLSFWQMHGQVVIITLAFATLFTILIVFLMHIIYQRRKSQALAEKNVQLARAVKAAQMANGAKSQFLAQMSHEIRTPLNAIIGLTSIAKTEVDKPQEVEEYFYKIEQSSKLLLGIINDILDMSAIEGGKMQIEQEPFNFKRQLSNIVAIFYQQTVQKNIDFEVDMQNVTQENLIGDELRVSQIMTNLLSNAVKFTSSGGMIRMTIEQSLISTEQVNLRFIVSDTGCGMSEDMKKRIFLPFEQQDVTTARKYGGSGLGLSITKHLVDMMHGNISVESTQNVGTSFIVDIPFGVCEQEVEWTSTVEMFSEIRTLIVDDDEEACKYCGILLQRLGINYDYTTEPEVALDMIGQAEDVNNPYRLCIIDWKMPLMNGIELAKQIREIFGNEEMIVIVSAYDLHEIEQEGRNVGVNHFISKPLFQSTLFDMLMKISRTSSLDTNSASTTLQFDFTGKKVLLAEDVALNMEVAMKFLIIVGIEVTCAEDGKQAVEIYEQAEDGYFDCILLDVNMPIMDGYEATKRIRSSNHLDAKSIPIYAMTANAFKEDVQRAFEAGMNGHIAKPIETQVLYQTLEDAFKK